MDEETEAPKGIFPVQGYMQTKWWILGLNTDLKKLNLLNYCLPVTQGWGKMEGQQGWAERVLPPEVIQSFSLCPST